MRDIHQSGWIGLRSTPATWQESTNTATLVCSYQQHGEHTETSGCSSARQGSVTNPTLTTDIPGHTEIYHPDTRPGTHVKDPGQGPVVPSRTNVQSVVLHSYAHVMLKVWRSVGSEIQCQNSNVFLPRRSFSRCTFLSADEQLCYAATNTIPHRSA